MVWFFIFVFLSPFVAGSDESISRSRTYSVVRQTSHINQYKVNWDGMIHFDSTGEGIHWESRYFEYYDGDFELFELAIENDIEIKSKICGGNFDSIFDIRSDKDFYYIAIQNFILRFQFGNQEHLEFIQHAQMWETQKEIVLNEIVPKQSQEKRVSFLGRCWKKMEKIKTKK